MEKLKAHASFGGETAFWQHDSRETKTKMKFSTFIPRGEMRGCLIWLAGLTCTEENFMAKAGAQRALAQHQLMVVCPDTSPRGLQLPHEHEADDFGAGAGFYVDATTSSYRHHYRMYSYVTSELTQMVEREFKQKKFSIFGHSMGGHGALVIGLRNPGLFRSVSAFSPIAHPAQAPWGRKAFTGYLGEQEEAWKEYDATELLRASRRHSRPLKIDQGSNDPFLEKQLLFDDLVAAAAGSGQSLEAQLRPGYDHSYYFISTFVEEHIAFHAKAMG